MKKLKCFIGKHERNGLSFGYMFSNIVLTHCKHCNRELKMLNNFKTRRIRKIELRLINKAKQEWSELPQKVKEEIKSMAEEKAIR